MKIIPAILKRLRTLADRTLQITFETNELTPEQVGEVYSIIDSFCYLAIKKDDFKQEEKEMIDNLESDYEDKGKTQSQRIKDVLYVLYNQNKQGYDDFQDFYRHFTNKFIEHIKSKLDA